MVSCIGDGEEALRSVRTRASVKWFRYKRRLSAAGGRSPGRAGGAEVGWGCPGTQRADSFVRPLAEPGSAITSSRAAVRGVERRSGTGGALAPRALVRTGGGTRAGRGGDIAAATHAPPLASRRTRCDGAAGSPAGC